MRIFKLNFIKILFILIFLLVFSNMAICFSFNKWLIVSPYEEATRAGIDIFQRGGNAFDAIVAVLASSSVVDPSTSGLGGETLIIAFSERERRVISINGTAKAPRTREAISNENFFNNEKNKQNSNLVNGLIPSTFDVWVTLLDQWGLLRLTDVFKPAISLARKGSINNLFAKKLNQDYIIAKLTQWQSSKNIYFKSKNLNSKKDIIVNKDLLNTLERLIMAEQAATTNCPCRGDNHRHQALFFSRNYFYTSNIAKEFSDFCLQNNGFIDYYDLATSHGEVMNKELVNALVESPAYLNYHGFDIYTCASANGGSTLLETLNIIEELPLSMYPENSANVIHLMAEVFRIARADQEKYIGDFNFIKCPLNGLLSPEYAKERIQNININYRRDNWLWGNPNQFDSPKYVYNGYPTPKYPEPSIYTDVFSESQGIHQNIDNIKKIIKEKEDDLYKNYSFAFTSDSKGNMVFAMTTLNSLFGSGVIIEPLGFFLNDGMKRFRDKSYSDDKNDVFNSIRPISNLLPVLVCKNNKPYFLVAMENKPDLVQILSQIISRIIDDKISLDQIKEVPFCLISGAGDDLKLMIDQGIYENVYAELQKKGWNTKKIDKNYKNQLYNSLEIIFFTDCKNKESIKNVDFLGKRFTIMGK